MEQPDWNSLSPAHLWRDWIAKSEAQWSESISQMMKNQQAGEALNRQLSELQLMHRQFSELAQASLAIANMPSRNDFEALDERMGRLEDGLAQVQASLSQLKLVLSRLPGVRGEAAIKAPARDRKPAAAQRKSRG
jgi:hypothetical protein